MNPNGLDAPAVVGSVLPVLRVLQTLWGLAAVVALGAYSLIQTVTYQAAVPVVPNRGGSALRPVTTGNAVPYAIGSEPLVVHLACGMEDARLARIYDPPPSGRSIIFRIDQSPDQMRVIYRGNDPQFARDTRLVSTPCMQSLIDSGEFP